MPLPNQPRRPFSLDSLGASASASASAPTITCRTCGCLNFSGMDDCEGCRGARPGGTTSAAQPAIARHPFLPTARPAAANGSSHSRPINATALATNGARSSVAAKENKHQPPSANAASKSGVSSSRPQAGESSSLGSTTKVVQPGSSLVAPAQPVQSARHTVPETSNGRPATSSAVSSSSATTTGGSVGATASVKRSRPPSASREVIDLISSDEESEGHQRREAKRARRNARLQESISRLALRPPEREENLVARTNDPPQEEEEQTEPNPRQGRIFDEVEFNQDDFPNAVEMAHAMRGRHTSSTGNSVASSAVSTPTSASLAPLPSPGTAPAAAQRRASDVVPAAVAVTRQLATVTSKGESNDSTAVSPAQAEVTRTHQTTPASSTSEVAIPITQQPTTATVILPDSSRKHPPAKDASPAIVSVSDATDQATLAEDASSATAGAGNAREQATPVEEDATPAATNAPNTKDQATPSVPETSAAEVSAPVSALTRTAATNGPLTTEPTASSSESSATGQRVAPSQCPIAVDDSEDESDAERDDNERTPLFLSRRFPSVAFNAGDFLTAGEGLNLARRSSMVTRIPDSPQSTSATATTTSSPTHSVSNSKSAPTLNPTPSQTTAAPTHSVVSNSSSAPALNPTVAKIFPVIDASGGAFVLLARRKLGVNASSSAAPTSKSVSTNEAKIKTERAATARPEQVVRIVKPALGQCSTDFIQFMHDSVDDDSDEDEELARAKLHEVVDLTNLTDESGEEDDDEDDYFEIIEAPELQSKSGSLAASEHNAANPNAAVVTGAVSSSTPAQTENGQRATVKRTRAPRPKETCALCEEKGWIRVLVHCSQCKKFYHKRCAREYGDENICWVCNLDDMIDDSELTEEHKNEVISIFGAFRQSSESDQGEDDDDEDMEDKADPPEEKVQASPPLDVTATRSARRWKEFLNVSTAPMEESFHTVTNEITEELQHEEAKTKYSKGFATKEDIENGMAEVVDHYANLQEKEERLQREERLRAPVVENPEGIDQTGETAASSSGSSDLPQVDNTENNGPATGLIPPQASSNTNGFVSR